MRKVMENGAIYLLWDETLSWERLSEYLTLVSEPRRRRLACMVSEKDKIASLLAQLLARYALTQALGVENTRLVFARDAFGKPYLQGHENVHFSVSHTDGCVAFACGDRRVGVDVEKHRHVDLRLAERYFDPREAKRIAESADPESAFFDIWTKKEAYLKMRGTGLTEPLRTFCVLDGALDAQIQTHTLPRHTLSVCRENGAMNDLPRQIEAERLLAAWKEKKDR